MLRAVWGGKKGKIQRLDTLNSGADCADNNVSHSDVMKPHFPFWVGVLAGVGLFLPPARVAALDTSRSIYQYTCRTWARETGLPVNSIRAIAQSKDGYLWLGTQKGLVRFDGIEFETFSLPNDLEFRPGVVSKLAGCGGGGLWFGVENGAIGFFDGARFHAMTNLTWVNPQMRVGALREDDQGVLWVGGAGGLGLYRREHTNGGAFLGQVHGVSALCEDGQHRVWLGTTDEGLYCYEEGRLEPFRDTKLKKEAIFAIAADTRGWLWVGTEVGLHCYDTNFARTEPIPSLIDVKALLADQHGAVWIGSASDGLIRYLNGKVQYLTRDDGLPDDFVTSLFEDSEGSLWVGTHEGLTQLSDVKFPIYSRADGLGRGACHGLCASPHGGIWSANTGGLSWFDGRRMTNYSRQAGLRHAYVKRVYEAKDGDVYFINAERTGGRDGREIDVLSHGEIVARHAAQTWPIALAEDARGVVVGVGGELFRVSRTELVPYIYQDGNRPELSWVRNLYGCPDGSILVATVNGLFLIKDRVLEHWGVEDGLSDYDVQWVCQDREGVIWAGLQTGMARIQGRRICNIDQSHGLADNNIFAIVPDHHGDLWMNSSRGFLRVNGRSVKDFAEGRTNRVSCEVYDGLESVKTIDTSDVEFNGCQSADGRIWFPTPPGPVMIDPDHISKNAVPPQVHIEQVRVNGADQMGAAARRAGPGKGEVVVQYTALSYRAPHRIQFRYRLEGYESDWVDGGDRRSVFYANLKPGTYTFAVEARSVDGVWSRCDDRFEIKLPPHYYQTAWFDVLCCLAGVSLVLGGYGLRVRQMARRQRKLEEANEALESRIRQRTGELAEQRNLLRTLIDHLPDSIFVKDRQSRVVIDNVAHAQLLGLKSPAEAVGKTDLDCLPREQAGKFYEAEQKLLALGTEYDSEETLVDARTGEARWWRTTKVPLRDSVGKIIGLAGINREITETKKSEAELESLHRKLVEASRLAGMADVATTVLHNVGNVLNSVNVSTSVLSDRLRQLDAPTLAKVAQLMQEQNGNLARFLTEDEKGRRLPEFLGKFAERLGREQKELLGEVRELAEHVDHIKKIITMQQAHAQVAGVSEIVRPRDLVEDALRLLRKAYGRHSVTLLREFAEVQDITVDRHKVIQILVNLLQNAKFACDHNQPENRRVMVRLARLGSSGVRIQVADNGVGIPADNLTRIFSQGFTTRKDGHGFGLHSGALAAQELGGSLSVYSEGPGKGATFTLDLCVSPPSAPKPIAPEWAGAAN